MILYNCVLGSRNSRLSTVRKFVLKNQSNFQIIQFQTISESEHKASAAADSSVGKPINKGKPMILQQQTKPDKSDEKERNSSAERESDEQGSSSGSASGDETVGVPLCLSCYNHFHKFIVFPFFSVHFCSSPSCSLNIIKNIIIISFVSILQNFRESNVRIVGT